MSDKVRDFERLFTCWRCGRHILISPPSGAARTARYDDVPAVCPHCGEDPKTARLDGNQP